MTKPSNPKYNALLYSDEQSYSCINCGKCCCWWDVPVTPSEKSSLETLDIPGIDFSKDKIFSKYNKRLFSINKSRDGRCFFLDENNLCIIHKKYGESVKPLACRFYPLEIINWQDKVTSATFRFDCPGVGSKNGVPIRKRVHGIKSFSKELHDKKAKEICAIYSQKTPSDTSGVHKLNKLYQEFLLDNSIDEDVRFYAASRLMEFHNLESNRNDIIDIDNKAKEKALQIVRNSLNELRTTIDNAPYSNLNVRMKFRYLLSGFTRIDEELKYMNIIKRALSRMCFNLKFIFGKGSLRSASNGYPNTKGTDPFSVSENIKFSREAIELYEHYFDSKIKAMHFCGSITLNLTYEEGMRMLIINRLAVRSFALLTAAGRDKKVVEASDMREGISIIDHSMTTSRFFALKHVKNVIAELCSNQNLPSLLKAL